MTNLLAKRHQRILAQFAASNLLVAFDYDGTLAPIVSVPARARMRASTQRLLKQVAQRYPTVVISGRSRDDLVPRLQEIPLAHISGNHGLEPWAEQRQYVRLVARWVKQLQPMLAGRAGIVVEDKTYSLSVHYRAAHDRKRALEAIMRAAIDLQGARLIGGKLVVNVLPQGAPTKGAALERVRRTLACDTALYVGDDETDEDAFGIVEPSRLLAVRVGVSERTQAAYCLKRQSDIDALLRRLIGLRPAGRSKVA